MTYKDEMETFEKWNYETDVLAIGAGAAGLTAAIWAKAAGAEAMILEKAPTIYSSSTGMSGGGWILAGTSTQEEKGINDSPDLYYNYLLTYNQGKVDKALLKTFVENAPRVYEWVMELGTPCLNLVAYGEMGKPRVHWTDVRATLKGLETECRERGIEILFETPATRLLLSPEGRVIGAQADEGGETIFIKARKGVVMGCGGFSANPDMLTEFCGPKISRMMPVGSPHNTGDGFKMGMSAGAALRDAYVLPEMALAACDTLVTLPQLSRDGGILVNINGKRFIDESLIGMELGAAAVGQPDRLVYLVYCENIPSEMSEIKLERHITAGGEIYTADTLTELAEIAGLPIGALVETVNNYNCFVEAGADPECGRITLDGHSGEPVKLDNPPYYCIPCTGAIYPTEMGLRIDETARVIDVFGNVIPGLYAAGLMAAMGLKGPSGRTLPALPGAFTFGYIAGRQAARLDSWDI